MTIKASFQEKIIEIPLTDIIPTKEIHSSRRAGKKYQQIVMSISEIGLVEHPVVVPASDPGKYLLLDGHMRYTALNQLGHTSVSCLVSNDDEAYSYNKYVARLTPIQEQRMILQAIEMGVAEEKIAKTLGVSRKTLQERIDLVKAICPQAVELLKDKPVTVHSFRVLRKLKNERQVAVAKIMIEQNNYTERFVKTLFDASSEAERVPPKRPEKIDQQLVAQKAKLEEENLALSRDLDDIKATYNRDMFHMTAVQAYLRRLMANEKVASYLKTYHEPIYDKFSEIVAFDLYGSEM